MEVSTDAVQGTLERLRRDGFDEAEVYAKSGHSRRIAVGAEGATTGFHREAGWAVRASGARASFAAGGTGVPDPREPWPDPDGEPFRLPDPVDSPPWSAPDDLDSSLTGEAEGRRLLDGLARELAAELPGARLATAVLEDGASEHALVNGRGISVRWRSRLAALRAEAILPRSGRSGPAVANLYLAEREARRFSPKVLARRLADRLAVAAGSEAAPDAERDRAEVLLDPAVATRLLAGLLPLWVGPDAGVAAQALRDRGGRLASPAVTLIDDGRLRGGVLSAPCDGEGVATRAVTLVDGGHFRQPLLAWNQLRGAAGGPAGRALAALASGTAAGRTVASGCARRPSWRDLPQPGPTHLYLRPQPDVGVGALLAEMARGYYLLDADASGGGSGGCSGSFDLEADRFRLPVRGFAVEAGRAVAPLPSAVLGGGIGALLRGVQAVGRDLTFLPLGGMIGSPSLLVTGLELTFPARRS